MLTNQWDQLRWARRLGCWSSPQTAPQYWRHDAFVIALALPLGPSLSSSIGQSWKMVHFLPRRRYRLECSRCQAVRAADWLTWIVSWVTSDATGPETAFPERTRCASSRCLRPEFRDLAAQSSAAACCQHRSTFCRVAVPPVLRRPGIHSRRARTVTADNILELYSRFPSERGLISATFHRAARRKPPRRDTLLLAIHQLEIETYWTAILGRT